MPQKKISLQQLHFHYFFQASRLIDLDLCWKSAEYCENKTCLVKMAHRCTCWSQYDLCFLNSFKLKSDTMCEMRSEIQNTFFIWGPHDYHSHLLSDMKLKNTGHKIMVWKEKQGDKNWCWQQSLECLKIRSLVHKKPDVLCSGTA